MSGAVRVDAWLWAVRVYKTRSAATAAVRGGHVRVNDEPVKAAHALAVGDRIRVRKDQRERILEVTGLIGKRVGAPVAVKNYIDHSPPPIPRELLAVPHRERGAGRPTKRDRRKLDELRGRASDERG